MKSEKGRTSKSNLSKQAKETCGSGNVRPHEGKESTVGVLKRKAGRPKL